MSCTQSCNQGRSCTCAQPLAERNGVRRVDTESRQSPMDHICHWSMVAAVIALTLFFFGGGAAFVYFNFIN